MLDAQERVGSLAAACAREHDAVPVDDLTRLPVPIEGAAICLQANQRGEVAGEVVGRHESSPLLARGRAERLGRAGASQPRLRVAAAPPLGGCVDRA